MIFHVFFFFFYPQLPLNADLSSQMKREKCPVPETSVSVTLLLTIIFVLFHV